MGCESQLVQHADCFVNVRRILLVHTSARYSLLHIHSLLQTRVPSSFRAKLLVGR